MNIDPALVRKAFAACTWGNTLETPEDWKVLLEGHDDEAKRCLFSRIFMEDPDGGFVRNLFERVDIMRYMLSMDRPLSRSHLEKRRKVWRYLYCGIKEAVPELDWIMRK